MSDSGILGQLIFIFILIAVNALFVLSEYAIVRVREIELDTLIKQGSRRAKLAKEVISRLDKYISATQLGITFVNLLIGWIGEDVFVRILNPVFDSIGLNDSVAKTLSVFIGLLLITYFTITLGELAPKAYAIRKYKQIALTLSYPLVLFYKIFKPFIWLLNISANWIMRLFGINPDEKEIIDHTEEEIRLLISESRKAGVIDSTEQQLIERIIRFNDKQAQQIMIPRNRVVAININDSREEILRVVTEEGYSRVPVYNVTIDNIIGVIYTKDLISASEHRELITLQDIIRPAFFTAATKQIGFLLKEMQKNRVHMAIVINEFGGVEGLITMEDIIEEIVGEIQDEYDFEKAEIIPGTGGEYLIDPIISIEDFNKNFEVNIPKDPYYNTIGGFLCKVTGHIPDEYERIDFENQTFIVTKKTGNAMKQIKVMKKL
ncbi:MAG TPA: hemolysin family protein [Ignavibacteria bacterium]|nr:hemolysin family protein [Ignavibacteria bacterium]